MSDYSGFAPANPGTDYPSQIAALLAALSIDTDKIDVAQLGFGFGQKRSTTTGLTYGYYGGVVEVAGTPTTVADGTVALSASTTNYVERDSAGAVSKNTTGFTAGRFPLALIVTGAGSITTVTDKRAGNAGRVPAGAMMDWPGTAVPAGWLERNGQNVSRTTYPELYAVLMRTSVVTFDNSTDKVAWAAHGLSNGDVFKFTTTGGAPTGLTAGTTYFVVSAGTNDFQIAATEGGAAINFTTNGTGVHTGIHAPFGDGDGSTTFTLPDDRRRATVGRGGSATATLGARLGATGGAETVTLSTSEMPSHTHGVGRSDLQVAAGVGGGYADSGSSNGASTSQSAGSGGAHNNMAPALVTTKIIKT